MDQLPKMTFLHTYCKWGFGYRSVIIRWKVHILSFLLLKLRLSLELEMFHEVEEILKDSFSIICSVIYFNRVLKPFGSSFFLYRSSISFIYKNYKTKVINMSYHSSYSLVHRSCSFLLVPKFSRDFKFSFWRFHFSI